jgi:hypothetical protein
VVVDVIVVVVVVGGVELPQALNRSALSTAGIKTPTDFEGRKNRLIANEV